MIKVAVMKLSFGSYIFLFYFNNVCKTIAFIHSVTYDQCETHTIFGVSNIIFFVFSMQYSLFIVLQGVLAGLLMRPKEEPAPAKMETTDLNLKLERIEPRQRIQSVISRRSMFRRQSNVSFRDAMERHRRKSSVHIDAAQMLHELQQEEIGEEEPTLRGQLCKLRESMWSMSLVKDGIFMAFFFSAGESVFSPVFILMTDL